MHACTKTVDPYHRWHLIKSRFINLIAVIAIWSSKIYSKIAQGRHIRVVILHSWSVRPCNPFASKGSLQGNGMDIWHPSLVIWLIGARCMSQKGQISLLVGGFNPCENKKMKPPPRLSIWENKGKSNSNCTKNSWAPDSAELNWGPT